ncbi:Virulence plasmid protein pGP6-D-related protein (plasmid) [Candidatus Protochlamydia naegleriophila]|uniref:Virulence plasmid protein pGP6-D-related protein n=1 Tax=Candidatus Protochlamydia naegleriophila TaxID=389348 RepID=A0A0U5EVA9_9BACT|nr:CT583 family protein [Candidatus Protochlamydia naegleriophila]CUI18192.1 Virulence plasmid protein pGP6-D-related protein [Candidatus Protochlamydia naegleriophila]
MSGISDLKNKAKLSFDEMFSDVLPVNPNVESSSLPAIVRNFHFSDKLEPEEEEQIEGLLLEGVLPEISSNELDADINEIKRATSEIKAIQKQGVVLAGERIFKVREILKFYKDGTFNKWLDLALGSRKTGYNLLAYFDFYTKLPNEEFKNKFQCIPQKAAYILASREGDIQKKLDIINSSKELKSDDIISKIKNDLPVKTSKSTSQKSNSKLIRSLQGILSQICEGKDDLSEEDRLELVSLKLILDKAIG